MSYDPTKIEKKWQKAWEKAGIFNAKEEKGKDKFYGLIEFPYPSGDGLHVGHPRGYTALDIVCRKRRMEGQSVLFPIGFDSFGLPTENYAIKTKTNPKEVTEKNIKTFTSQLKSLGFSFDWTRAISTSDPEYYKWTQWIFIQLFKKGLAHKIKQNINWCISCKIGLANEEVVGGACERCGGEVIKKEKEQWVLRITQYADRLIDDLKCVDYLERIKDQQINWIGRSEGARINFEIRNLKSKTNLKSKNQISKVLLATNNKAKLRRIKKLIKISGFDIEIVIPSELGLKERSPKEGGALLDNAKEKALMYRDQTDLPILGYDAGLFIRDERIDPAKVKRNALLGKKENELKQEEIAQLMIDFYMKIVEKNGGQVDAHWRDVSALSFKDGTIRTDKSSRYITITDKQAGVKIDPYMPLRSFYKSKDTGKYSALQTDKEELIELKPYTDSLYRLLGGKEHLEVFTSRPDTIYGATFMVVSPEHPVIKNNKISIDSYDQIQKYVKEANKKTDRTEKEKTGVEIKGIKAINPANKKEVPVFVADYVSMDYGTGAIMAVPAHDQRDFEFAKKYNLEIVPVIKSKDFELPEELLEASSDEGTSINSPELNGLEALDAIKKATKLFGVSEINYHLRDWVFSRQRYWGEPIPLIYCEKCGWQPVDEKDLPVKLPEIKDFVPTDEGDSPLAKLDSFVNTKCPNCGGKAKRETDVMPNWAGSNWYFLRYADAHNDKKLASADKLKYWTPVDWYNGGMEHTTLHLLYSRFIYKFLYDIGSVPKECGVEPYKKRTAHGMILGEGGIKMSKSKGNVINPDDYVNEYGADTVRMYEMFMGPFDQAIPWEGKSVIGVYRFLSRVWDLFEKIDDKFEDSEEVLRGLNKTIKKSSEDIEEMKFNTAVSQQMTFLNILEKEKNVSRETYGKLLTILSPFAPHMTEELWQRLGHKNFLSTQPWPEYDKKLLKEDKFNLVVQINGKVRATIEVKVGLSESDAKELALSSSRILGWMNGKETIKTIYIKDRLINFVVR